jgi:hypothetical protein
MATFYLLPSRNNLSRRLTSYFQTWFPGLDVAGADLVDLFAAAAERQAETHVIFADDLAADDGPDFTAGLRDGFGAEGDDCIIDVRNGPLPGDGLRMWRAA